MKPIYLDYQATTPMDPRVLSAMEPYWTERFGNPHSEGHPFGWEAREAVNLARSKVADFIGADDAEVVFVSGATESCNLALRGVAAASTNYGDRRQVITVATEHAAVLETVCSLGTQGFDIAVLPVCRDGLVDLHQLESTLSDRTLLVSVMLANNEIGVIQPLAEISALCQDAGAVVHTDATQAAGRIRIDVDELGVDLLSLSGHKIYGPNGAGVLYVRQRPGLRIDPILTGGSQEGGIRPGTVPAPLVVGLGEACRIAQGQMNDDARHMDELGRRLVSSLGTEFPYLEVFGHSEKRIPGSWNVGIPGVLGERLVAAVSAEVAISTGAACATGSPEPSHVLLAMGLDHEIASSAVRISLGRFTSEEEIDTASKVLREAIKAIREEV